MAEIVWGLVPISCAVTVAVQVAALPPLGESVQVPLNVSPFAPVSEEVNDTLPPGFDVVPTPAVSVTVTVTVLDPPTKTEVGLRATEVEVLRAVTLKVLLVAPVREPLEAASV